MRTDTDRPTPSDTSAPASLAPTPRRHRERVLDGLAELVAGVGKAWRSVSLGSIVERCELSYRAALADPRMTRFVPITDDDDERPSKTALKKQAHEQQALGEALAALSEARLAAIEMPEALREALHEYQRTRSHEGRRRQRQHIGKLMRQADIAPLQEAVAEAQLGRAHDALALHRAEHWRVELVANDEALTRWLAEHPDTDAAAAAQPDPQCAQGRGTATRTAPWPRLARVVPVPQTRVGANR